MKPGIARSILLCASLFAVACGADGPDESVPYGEVGGGTQVSSYGNGGYGGYEPSLPAADPDCNETTPAYEQVTALAKCMNCHASTKTGADRKSAPASVNFDTKSSADHSAERAAAMVMSGAMPPSTTGVKLTDVEKRQLYAWAKCAM